MNLYSAPFIFKHSKFINVEKTFDTTTALGRADLYQWAAEYATNQLLHPSGVHMENIKGKGFCFLFKMVKVNLYHDSQSLVLMLFRQQVPELYDLVPKEWSGLHMFTTDEEGWQERINLLHQAKVKALEYADRSSSTSSNAPDVQPLVQPVRMVENTEISERTKILSNRTMPGITCGCFGCH